MMPATAMPQTIRLDESSAHGQISHLTMERRLAKPLNLYNAHSRYRTLRLCTENDVVRQIYHQSFWPFWTSTSRPAGICCAHIWTSREQMFPTEQCVTSTFKGSRRRY